MKTLSALVFAAVVAVSSPESHAGDPVWLEGKTDQQYEITVYRSATCGCCKAWIDHLEDHAFIVKDEVVENVNSHKQRLGVPAQGASCHTAEVNGKVIEGHVPAQDIKKLLAEKSNVRLLTVPGMPSGGPGMDMAGARKDAFKVYSVDSDDKVAVYSSYENY